MEGKRWSVCKTVSRMVVATLQKEPAWRDIPVIVITALDLDAKEPNPFANNFSPPRNCNFRHGLLLHSRVGLPNGQSRRV
jgi:hypothetical protein